MEKDNKVTIGVNNFGFIQKGQVELKPLTILTGESNMGKSWFATLVYALYSYTSGNGYRPSGRGVDYKNLQEKDAPFFIDDIDIWLQNLEHRRTIVLNDNETKVLQSYFDSQAKLVESEVNRCLGNTNSEKIIRNNSKKKAVIRFDITQNKSGGSYASILLNMSKKKSNYMIRIPQKLDFSQRDESHIRRFHRHLCYLRDEDSALRKKYLLNDLLELINKKMLGTDGALYIPAGRVGLINNFRTIISSVLQQDSEEEKQTFRPMSGVNIDFLTKLFDLTQREPVSSSKLLTKRLESKILQGQVMVKLDSFNMPYFYYKFKNSRDPIPLNMASSMVSQLASCVLLCRYYGGKNKLLIIEEPEAHLHPEQQVLLANEICRWVQEDYKVLLTTHSEWFIEAIRNNIVSKSKDLDRPLDPNRVGVWNFCANEEKTGAIISEAVWDQDCGGFETGFADVAHKLHNRWVKANGRTA